MEAWPRLVTEGAIAARERAPAGRAADTGVAIATPVPHAAGFAWGKRSRQQALDLMRVGIAEAEGLPEPDASLLFEHAYANPPASLRRDLEELPRILGRQPRRSSRTATLKVKATRRAR